MPQNATRVTQMLVMSPRGIRRIVRISPAVAILSLLSLLAIQVGILPQAVRVIAAAIWIPAMFWTATVGALWLSRRERGVWMLGALLGVFVVGFLGLMTYAIARGVVRGRYQDLVPLLLGWIFGITMLRFIAGVSLANRRVEG